MAEHSDFTDEEVKAVREYFELTTRVTKKEKEARWIELRLAEGPHCRLTARGIAIFTMLEVPRTRTKAEIAAIARHYAAKTDKEKAAAGQELLDLNLGYVFIHGSAFRNL